MPAGVALSFRGDLPLAPVRVADVAGSRPACYCRRVLIATWNVNGLRARLDFVSHWLRARQPDLVGLQETKTADEVFPHPELEALGYHAVVHGQKAWNGVAILSRERPSIVERGLPGQESSGARLLAVRVAGLLFATAYCPNGKHLGHEDFGRKLGWMDALASWVKQAISPTEQAVICGDFNVCPGALDSWNEAALAGHIFHTEEERGRFRHLLECGLHDVFRDRHPDARTYSWWDYRGGAFHRGQGLRIDLLLATRTVMDRVTRVEIDREYRKKKEGLVPSDHAPVMAELE